MTTKRVFRDCGRGVSAALALTVVLALPSCTGLNIVDDNQTPFLMTISDIVGEGATSGSGAILLSDVSDTFNDDATLTVTIFRKNPNIGSTGPLEMIRLQRYEVRFTRSDGRNVEGVDVPFRFTGPLNTSLTAPSSSGTTTADVIVSVVRHQAKFEPPLKNMIGIYSNNSEPGTAPAFSGAGILTTIAEITIHGVTLTGEGLVASARLQVTFADFADK